MINFWNSFVFIDRKINVFTSLFFNIPITTNVYFSELQSTYFNLINNQIERVLSCVLYWFKKSLHNISLHEYFRTVHYSRFYRDNLKTQNHILLLLCTFKYFAICWFSFYLLCHWLIVRDNAGKDSKCCVY